MNGEILTTRTDDTLTVTLSHPSHHNAMTTAMWKALASVFQEASRRAEAGDTTQRAIIVRGAGGHFAAGADISEFPHVRMTQADAMRYHMQTVGHALDAIERCPLVTIAAIEGNCIGGGLEIALACDLRIAQEGAIFAIPAGKLGFALAPTELRLVFDTIGRTAAAELLLECATFDVARAVITGLITRACTNLDAELAATLKRMRTGSAVAAQEHKAWFRRLAADRTGRGTVLNPEEMRQAMAFAERDDYQQRVERFLQTKTG